MPFPKPNRWHPVMLPDDYIRKMKQNLSEAETTKTGGFASLMPQDAAHAVEVCRNQDSLVSSRVQLRMEPEHPGPTSPPLRPTTPRRFDIMDEESVACLTPHPDSP